MSVLPTEAQRIRGILRVSMLVAVTIALGMAGASITYYRAGVVMYAVVVAFWVIGMTAIAISCAVCLWGHKCWGEPMPPRRMLMRLWQVWRLQMGFFAIGFAASAIGDFHCYKTGPLSGKCLFSPAPLYFVTANFALWVALASPSIRGRIYRWFGSLGKDASAEQKAASVASLLGLSLIHI